MLDEPLVFVQIDKETGESLTFHPVYAVGQIPSREMCAVVTYKGVRYRDWEVVGGVLWGIPPTGVVEEIVTLD